MSPPIQAKVDRSRCPASISNICCPGNCYHAPVGDIQSTAAKVSGERRRRWSTRSRGAIYQAAPVAPEL